MFNPLAFYRKHDLPGVAKLQNLTLQEDLKIFQASKVQTLMHLFLL